MARRKQYNGSGAGLHVEWVTIRHRTVYLAAAVLIGLAVVAGVGYYVLYVAIPAAEGDVDTTHPAVAGTETGARFIEVSGSVKVRKAGTYAWIDARLGVPLQKNDHVKTDSKSTARVRFFDGTEYFVKSDTILVIEESHEDPGTKERRVAVKLTAGQVNLQTPNKNVSGSRSELATPTTEATFGERTIADVRFDDAEQVSGFTVFRGSTRLEAGQNRLELGSNEKVEVSPDLQFSDVVKLPDIPSIESPAHMATLVHSQPSGENTVLRWRSVEGARRYHVVLDRTPNFTDPLWESKVRGSTAVVPGLTSGSYYWKVAAIDDKSRMGGYSGFAKFNITTRSGSVEPPKLLVSRPTATLDGIVTVRGTTDPDAVVTVGNERVSVRPDGSFHHRFMIRNPGRHDIVVRAVKRSGGEAERTFQLTIGSDGL